MHIYIYIYTDRCFVLPRTHRCVCVCVCARMCVCKAWSDYYTHSTYSLFYSKSSLHLPHLEKHSIFKPLEYITKPLFSRNYLDESGIPN